MCELKKYHKTSNTQIDKCMREEVKEFNKALKLLKPYTDNLKIVACCCGHGKYKKTIVIKRKADSKDELDSYFEHFSLIDIPRSRNFYVKDKQGYYYIPELKRDYLGMRSYWGDYTGDKFLYDDNVQKLKKPNKEEQKRKKNA